MGLRRLYNSWAQRLPCPAQRAMLMLMLIVYQHNLVNIAPNYKTRPALERPGRDASKESPFNSFRQTTNVKRREGKKNPADSSDETRVGKLRARRIQIEAFDAFAWEGTRRKRR
mmetsp:Transcript_19638/g.35649  ORF Transcript_19638/g.35649 Transcript_19638/m.35649 type:complete len:114 (+) Transcript_19638:146-487(+)